MTEELQLLKVKLKGGAPWGFRLQGGSGSPLVVSMVRRKSKAYNILFPEDLFISVNSLPCNDLSYDQVMAIADKRKELEVEIKRKPHKIENGFSEDKFVFSSKPPAQDTPQTTLITNTVKVTETENRVTKESTTANREPIVVPLDSVSVTQESISHHKEDIQNHEEKELEDGIVKLETNDIATEGTSLPEVTSDVTISTKSEDTPNSQKFETMKTEKVVEKHDNVETTAVRTDYEKMVKSTNEVLPDTKLVELVDIKEQVEKNMAEENCKATIKTESFEIRKSEVKTTKMNGSLTSSLGSLEKNGGISSSPCTNLTDIPKLDATLGNSFGSNTFSSMNVSESTIFTKKKKMFSSSSFYEEPQSIYPTMEEQFEMAKKIAESLADDTNKKSKGANMFFKRAKRSTKWIHEGSDFGDENSPEIADSLKDSSCSLVSHNVSDFDKKHPKLKLLLDPRHPVDLASLRSTGHIISEHNVISPDICHDLVRDLESPAGKGSALFAKRKKKSSEWIVDEEKVKSLMKAQEIELKTPTPISSTPTPKSGTPYISPWNTALDSKLRFDPASKWVNPDHLAETVMKAADNKRRDSIQSQEDYGYDVCRSPITPATPAASYYDIYKAKAPKGWSATSTGADTSDASSSISPIPLHSGSATLASKSPKKFNFQNFNTLPRKWKAQY